MNAQCSKEAIMCLGSKPEKVQFLLELQKCFSFSDVFKENIET